MAPTAVNMIGGEGPSSYDRNSVFQGETLRLLGAPLLETAVRHWLKLQQASSGKGPLGTAPIMVADLGCSTGKNSVMHMQRVEQWLRLDDTERAALEGGGKFWIMRNGFLREFVWPGIVCFL